MGKKLFFGVFFLLVLKANGQHLVRFQINSLPSNDGSVFIAGSFNNWSPGDTSYRFTKGNNGKHFFETVLNEGTYEFKLTRGSWEYVECKADGKGVSNRMLQVDRNTTVELEIEGWSDQFAKVPKVSTAGKNVSVMDTAFFMPQLNRHRRIWIYLPENYSNSKRKYPVIYMQDGQNVFDELTSYSGEWGVDEALDSLGNLVRQSIVVAIDNGLNYRMNEYSPYDMERFGNGEGDQYVDFLVKTLKPYIDKHYRTLSNKRNTVIAGSSMGGLISMYAVLKYPQVFGAAGIFSPSFWIAPKLHEALPQKARKVKSDLYFYMGGAEGKDMVQAMEQFVSQIKEKTQSKSVSRIIKEGRHHEADWRKVFPDFYKWIFSN